MRSIPFDELESADLEVGAIYEGGLNGALAGEPLSKTLKGSGNQGGIRVSGRAGSRRFVILYTTFADAHWPDHLDENRAHLEYFGDNKTPSQNLHDTNLGGNSLLREVFEALHARPDRRREIPPIFLFSRCQTPSSRRSARFHGICAPGYPGLTEMEDLVAVWKTGDGGRFQNYRAIFTVLDIPIVKRAWIKEIIQGNHLAHEAPDAWRSFVELGQYNLLRPAQSEALLRSIGDSVQ